MSEGETLNMGDMDGAERTTTEEETEAGEAASKYSTSVKLKQQLCIVPDKLKECYLVYILTKMTGRTCMVFARTCDTTNLLARLLRNLGIRAIPINGQMTRTRRLRDVNQFKAGECKIIICTDMASRGLHFDGDLVINYEVPPNSKDYIHRVGRTARAERSGVAISLVNQFEVEWYLNIEALLEGCYRSQKARPYMKLNDSGGKKRSKGVEDEEDDVQKYVGGKNSKDKKANKS